MERVYPKPTTQAMMIRLIQDYYDCPIFYMPWTREALTVHLYEPLTEQQMADAELAEAIERSEQNSLGLRSETEQAADSVYLNFDMGTDLVKPDVFTKQMYMRVFIRQVFQLDKGYISLFESRVRLGTMYDDGTSVASKSRAGSVYSKEAETDLPFYSEARIMKNVNNWNPRGELVKVIPNDMGVSVKKLSIAPTNELLYWGDAIGRIGYVDMDARSKSYNNHVIIQTSGPINNLQVIDEGERILYSTQDGLLSLLHVESHASDSFSQIMEYSRAVPTLITAIGSSSSPFSSCFFFSSLRDVTVCDLRTRTPVQVLRLNSSLGAVSSLVYDVNTDVLVAGTTRGYIPVYNMRYPLLVNLWQQSDSACITRMTLGQDTHVNPTVWTTSGDNRIHLWDVKTGECMSSLTVCEGNAPVDEVVLNAVPVRGINEVLGTGLVSKQCRVFKHGISAFLLPPYVTAESKYAPAYMLTAGGDRCVRFWSFDSMIPSHTVCEVEKSGVRDVYQHQGARYMCSEERTKTKLTVGEEVKPIHATGITDAVIVGSEKEEGFATSCVDGMIRIWS